LIPIEEVIPAARADSATTLINAFKMIQPRIVLELLKNEATCTSNRVLCGELQVASETARTVPKEQQDRVPFDPQMQAGQTQRKKRLETISNSWV
jgi:hypothetical protein